MFVYTPLANKEGLGGVSLAKHCLEFLEYLRAARFRGTEVLALCEVFHRLFLIA